MWNKIKKSLTKILKWFVYNFVLLGLIFGYFLFCTEVEIYFTGDFSVISLFVGAYFYYLYYQQKENEERITEYAQSTLKNEQEAQARTFIKLIYETDYNNYKKIRSISLDDADMSKVVFFFDNNINYKISIEDLLWVKNQNDIMRIDSYLDMENTNSLDDYRKILQYASILDSIIRSNYEIHKT